MTKLVKNLIIGGSATTVIGGGAAGAVVATTHKTQANTNVAQKAFDVKAWEQSHKNDLNQIREPQKMNVVEPQKIGMNIPSQTIIIKPQATPVFSGTSNFVSETPWFTGEGRDVIVKPNQAPSFSAISSSLETAPLQSFTGEGRDVIVKPNQAPSFSAISSSLETAPLQSFTGEGKDVVVKPNQAPSFSAISSSLETAPLQSFTGEGKDVIVKPNQAPSFSAISSSLETAPLQSFTGFGLYETPSTYAEPALPIEPANARANTSNVTPSLRTAVAPSIKNATSSILRKLKIVKPQLATVDNTPVAGSIELTPETTFNVPPKIATFDAAPEGTVTAPKVEEVSFLSASSDFNPFSTHSFDYEETYKSAERNLATVFVGAIVDILKSQNINAQDYHLSAASSKGDYKDILTIAFNEVSVAYKNDLNGHKAFGDVFANARGGLQSTYFDKATQQENKDYLDSLRIFNNGQSRNDLFKEASTDLFSRFLGDSQQGSRHSGNGRVDFGLVNSEGYNTFAELFRIYG